MYCKHCGKEISDDSRFCRFCGKLLIGGTGETISAGGDAFTGIDTNGMAAIGRGIIQIQIQEMSEEHVRKVISSQLSPILSEIGIKNNIGSEPIELTQEQQEIGEAITDKVNEADQWFDKPLGTPDTYLKLGNFEYEGKNYEKAIEYYDEIIKIDIRNVNAWSNKGVVLDKLERSDEAIRCFDKALEINPKYADAWYNEGTALGNLGRYDEAIGCYDKALEIKPEYANAWNNKGIALGNLERSDEAIRCFDKALEIDPEHKFAKENREIAKRSNKII